MPLAVTSAQLADRQSIVLAVVIPVVRRVALASRWRCDRRATNAQPANADWRQVVKYLGTARCENGHVVMPDGFTPTTAGQPYEVVEIDGDIVLTLSPLDRARLACLESLARQTIQSHRKTLEGLAK